MSARRWVAAMILLGAATAAAAESPRIDRVRVFYFGNSLTGSTMPALHPALGKTAGKEWVWDIMPVAGGQVWQYMEQFRTGAKLESVGDYTLDQDLAKETPWSARKFLEGEWDAIVIQPFATHLVDVCTEKWGKHKWDEPRDLGDIAASKYLIDLFLKKNPAGRVFVYQDWPGMPLYRSVTQNVLPRGKELNDAQMLRIRRSFDYPGEWMREYDADVPPWECNAQSRDYEWRLMDELIAAYPQLWREGRLCLIPVGDVYYLLDRKMRAGQVPDVLNIGEYYTDGLHNRAGMPAYTCSATFFTLLFREPPGRLDAEVYNDQGAYGKDRHNDHGAVLTITPERARIINDTIRDVVKAHPYTNFGSGGSRQLLAKLEETVPAPEPVRILEFGSAALLSSMPGWHTAFDRTAGKHSSVEFFAGRGGSLSAVCRVIEEKGWPHTAYVRELSDPKAEVLCLEPAGEAFVESRTEGGMTELKAAERLGRDFLERHPRGRLVLVFGWPRLEAAARLRSDLALKSWQPAPEDRMEPLRRAFDYTAAWNAPESRQGTAAGMRDFMEGMRKGLPEARDRIRAAPLGAVLAAVDARLKEGCLPGLSGVGEFYKDEVMLRTGLPRYLAAATIHATVFGSSPEHLSGDFFNDPKSYCPDAMDPEAEGGPGKVPVRPEQFDNGPHLAVTPEGKRLADEAIREVLSDTVRRP